jgi:uncharacterized protein
MLLMFSLQRMVGGDGEFFTLLEASAEQAAISAKALAEVLGQSTGAPSLDKLIAAHHKDRHITEEIHALLCRTFVTPLEREDIEKLSRALYKVPKTLEKFIEQLAVSQSLMGQVDFTRQVQIVAQATNIVLNMVKDVRRNPELAEVKEMNDRLQSLEGEADKLLLSLMRDLYSGRYNAVQVVAVGGLYQLLEKAIDRCRDAGNVLFGMALKLC